MKSVFALTLAFAFVTPVFAHEGHDHDAPATVQAPKGGQIKSLEETYVEVLVKGKDIKVFLYDKSMNPKNAKGFEVSASAEFPRTKSKAALVLNPKDTYFEGHFDAKNAHRYTFILNITDPQTTHKDQLNFTIEP